MAEVDKSSISDTEKAKHTLKAVYGKVEGGNNEITFDAVYNGKKIPVTTKKFNREENHFVFPEAVYKEDASDSSGE